jgi:hypothetical protein
MNCETFSDPQLRDNLPTCENIERVDERVGARRHSHQNVRDLEGGESFPGIVTRGDRRHETRCADRTGPVFDFRLRILDVRERDTDPFSYLGIVEGFPDTPGTHRRSRKQDSTS